MTDDLALATHVARESVLLLEGYFAVLWNVGRAEDQIAGAKEENSSVWRAEGICDDDHIVSADVTLKKAIQMQAVEASEDAPW